MKMGLSRGDLLSPLPFYIIAETLSKLLQKAEKIGIIRGIKMGNRAITHLQYADNVILFSSISGEGLRNLKRVLRCFTLITSLKVNFHKSALMGINAPRTEVEGMAERLLCRSESLPIKYLGIPLRANPGRYRTWEGVIRNFRSWLSEWKGKFLSMERRITLVKSILNSIPIFLMSLYKMPKRVRREMELLTKLFVWKGNLDNRCLHKIKRSKICLPHERDGACIVSVEIKNRALLLK